MASALVTPMLQCLVLSCIVFCDRRMQPIIAVGCDDQNQTNGQGGRVFLYELTDGMR